jgi:hypothetical protein
MSSAGAAMSSRQGRSRCRGFPRRLPATRHGDGSSRARRRRTRVGGAGCRRASCRGRHGQHAKQLGAVQARQSPVSHRCPGARRHPASTAHPGADTEVLPARGTKSRSDDRKVSAGPQLHSSPAERVFAPAPPCEDSGQSLRCLRPGARGRRALLREPGRAPRTHDGRCG